ncbi:MAG: M28 family peptidase [Candidatus Paceibacterota bacterium]|nr:M28 family peptidase [bacterium]
MEKFDQLKFIKEFISLGQRQGEIEIKASELIIKYLKNYAVEYFINNFQAKIPLTKKAVLLVDNIEVPCKGSSFVSGEINSKDNLISSLITPLQFDFFIPNINFNPNSKHISLASHYFAPSVAVNMEGLEKILKGEKVFARVDIEPLIYESKNILVGNKNNPKNIIFAHYDSIEQGATDNASSIAVLMAIASSFPELLRQNLLVFSGNEELSYDQPIYWGHGYRVFEDNYSDIMEKAEKIIVLDCVGNGETIYDQDKEFIYLAFPLKNLKKWENKIFSMQGSLSKMLKTYHSKGDNLKQLEEKYLNEALDILIKKL